MATSYSVVFILAVVFLVGGHCDVSKRDVKTTYWPDCAKYKSCQAANNTGTLPNLVYVKASTKTNDNLYYAFSTIEAPTVVMAHSTGGDNDMLFDWEKLLAGSVDGAISFSRPGKVDYISAVVITKLIQYDDVHDTADLESCEKEKDVKWDVRKFSNFTWQTLTVDKDRKNTFVFTSTDDKWNTSVSNNGSISFRFQVPYSNGRGSELPRLKYFVNETLFDFTINNFTALYDNSRFALEAVFASQSVNKNMNVETTRTIDDEYAPGVFEITDVLSDPSKKSVTGFLQWKPVCYFDKSRSRSTATKVKHYDLLDMADRTSEVETVNKSLAFALFRERLWNESVSIVRTMNISFGLPKDGFYTKNNYTVWTASIGYGNPPTDTISLTVIIIISCGLGIPVLIIIFGGIFTVYKKTVKKGGYDAIEGSVDAQQSVIN